MLVETLLEDARWEKVHLPVLAEGAASAVLNHLGLAPGQFEIALLACDDARIAALNQDFRDKASATNVLSWPSEDLTPDQDGGAPHPPDPEGEAHLGDIALAYDTCAQEAADAGRPFEAHVTHLVIHGVLHLLGYDHIRDADATLMEGLEVEILGNLGLPDPYRQD